MPFGIRMGTGSQASGLIVVAGLVGAPIKKRGRKTDEVRKAESAYESLVCNTIGVYKNGHM